MVGDEARLAASSLVHRSTPGGFGIAAGPFRRLPLLHNSLGVRTGSTDGDLEGGAAARRPSAGSAGPAAMPPQVRALRRARRLNDVGAGILRIGLAFLLALFGTFKFFRFEAHALEPVVRQSPLVAWTYLIFSVRTAAALMGGVEVVAALGLLLGPRWPTLGVVGGSLASMRFFTTLTFLLTAPELLASWNQGTGFFLKDLVLLGASIQVTAGFLLARRARPVALAQPIPLRIAR